MLLPILDWVQSVKSLEIQKKRLWSKSYCGMFKADLEASDSCSPHMAPRSWPMNVFFAFPNWRLQSQIRGALHLGLVVLHLFVDRVLV